MQARGGAGAEAKKETERMKTDNTFIINSVRFASRACRGAPRGTIVLIIRPRTYRTVRRRYLLERGLVGHCAFLSRMTSGFS